MKLPPPWLLAAVAVGVGLLIVGVAYADEIEEAMLPADLWNKKPLTGSKLAWAQRLRDEAGPVFQAGGYPRSVAFAQAAVESGWGTSMPSNPWGLRGVGDAGSNLITTKECYGGAGAECVTLTGQQFRKFSSLTAAASGYLSWMANNVKQPQARGWWLTDPGRWLLYAWGARTYATANSYAATVVDASRKLAVSLNDGAIAIPWSDWHASVAKQIGAAPAGSQRRALTLQLLGLA